MHRNSLYYLSYFSSGDIFPEKLNAFHNAKNSGNFGRRLSETVVTVWSDRNIQGVVHFWSAWSEICRYILPHQFLALLLHSCGKLRLGIDSGKATPLDWPGLSLIDWSSIMEALNSSSSVPLSRNTNLEGGLRDDKGRWLTNDDILLSMGWVARKPVNANSG